MGLKLLKTQEDYNNAVKALEKMGDDPNFEDSTDLIEEFELLAKLIEDFEHENFPIKPGDPIEIIKLKMNHLGLKPKDLEQFIGSKGTVSEVLNKKRGLSKNMIRKLSIGLSIDQRILNSEPFENGEDVVRRAIPIFVFAFSPQATARIRAYKYQVQNRRMLFNVCP